MFHVNRLTGLLSRGAAEPMAGPHQSDRSGEPGRNMDPACGRQPAIAAADRPQGRAAGRSRCGAGFPGLVLAIVLSGEAGNTIQLIESNGKKVAFLRQAAQSPTVPLGSHQGRIEQMGAETVGAPISSPPGRLPGLTRWWRWRRLSPAHTPGRCFTRAKMWTEN